MNALRRFLILLLISFISLFMHSVYARQDMAVAPFSRELILTAPQNDIPFNMR